MSLIVRMLVGMICLAVPSVVGAQDWSDYKPGSLSKIWSETSIVEGTDYSIETINAKFVVEAVYTGEHREVGQTKLDLLRKWVKSLGHPKEYAQMFEHEIRVQAGKDTFWLALQNQLVESFAREATAGSQVRLYIMYIGAVKTDRLFVVNRFKVLQ